MAKNLVFLSDGTGNSKLVKGEMTNIGRLSDIVQSEGEAWWQGGNVSQIALYDPGIGSPTRTAPVNFIAQLTGAGIGDNIRDAYRFLARHYEPGDRIFLFGFSRGAYTVRSVGGLLGVVGLPKRDGRADRPDLEQLVARAYEIYKMSPSHDPINAPGDREDAARTFIAREAWTEHRLAESRAPWLIGVWDTVRALGIPLGERDFEIPGYAHRFHDHELNRHVRHAYHALAIDEERAQFLPTVWNEPTAAQCHAQKTGVANPQQFEQVWFPGVHSDVGGGYGDAPHEAGKGKLSDVTFDWMLTRALKAGLLLKAAQPTALINPDAQVNDSRDTFWKKLIYARIPRNVVRGHQGAGTTVFETEIGPGRLNAYWLRRVSRLFGTTGAYEPEALFPHPDFNLATQQLEAGRNPPPGPFPDTVA